MVSNYYTILQVNQNSTLFEIKKSYRKLAKMYHPDVSKFSDCEERFKEISTAYVILSNTKSRNLYDEYLEKLDSESNEEFVKAESNAEKTVNEIIKVSLSQLLTELNKGTKDSVEHFITMFLVFLKMCLFYVFIDIFISSNPNYFISILSLLAGIALSIYTYKKSLI